MEKRIDLLDYLSRAVQDSPYPYDSARTFCYDVRTITNALQENDMENRVFYWMICTTGTWCVKERDVFLRESEGHAIWTHYESVADGIRAFRIVVTGLRNGIVVGDVYPLNYKEQVQRIKKAALPIATVEITYPSGYTARMTFAELEKCRGNLYDRYGRPQRIRYAPENEADLTRAIMLEHRFEKGWKRKPYVKPPVETSR